MIIVTQTTSAGWVLGSAEHDGNLYSFEAKVYDTPSDNGIGGGRVSKLSVRTLGNKVVFNYDRGLDIDHLIGYRIALAIEDAGAL